MRLSLALVALGFALAWWHAEKRAAAAEEWADAVAAEAQEWLEGIHGEGHADFCAIP